MDSQQYHPSPFRSASSGVGGLEAEQRQGEDGDVEESEAGGEEGALPVLRVLHQGKERACLPSGRLDRTLIDGHRPNSLSIPFLSADRNGGVRVIV